MNWFTRCAIVCACVVWLFEIAAFGQKLPFKNYTTADGLANDFVGEIVRDSRGFLWFCTGEGLSRFDGHEFKNYTQAHGLPHRNVNDLLELGNGIYLAATGDGISVFNPHGTANPQSGAPPMFYTVRAESESPDQKSVSVNDLLLTRKGEIWAASEISLLRIVRDGDDWHLEKIEFDAWRGKNIEISSIAEDRFGRLWLGTGVGLFIFNLETGAHFQVPETTGWSLAADQNGRIWAGGAVDPSDAVHLFELTDADSPPVARHHFTKADGLTDNQWIHALFNTSDGRVLAGIRNGLNEFMPEAQPGEPVFRQMFSADVISVGEDAGGNIWVGTATRGVFKLTRGGFTLYQTAEKPPYGGVTSIFAGDSPNEVFITSSENDLLRFDGEKFVEIQFQSFKSRSWSRNQLDLRSRVDGDWWIPTSDGLARYAAVRKFEDLARAVPKKIYRAADGLHADALFNLYEDRNGDIWSSTIAGVKDRLMRWERSSDKIRRYTTDDGLPDNNAPTAFAEDSEGNLWIGFYAGGAARSRKDGKFRFFSRRDGFPNGYVTAIHADRSGRLWFATSSGGVIRLDNPADDAPQFINLNVAGGLSSNQANCITEDNFGRIYIGTARGINRIEPETGRIKLYTQTDGLPGNAVSRCARDASGNLWFSQKFNLARLNVQADEQKTPPTIYIGNLLVNGEPVRKLSELGEAAVENLSLASDQRQIQIDFFAVGFGTGETLRYQYKFEGSNADWSEPSAQRTVNLNLSPGRYSFLVRAINAEGVTSESPARISFSIARPFWQQWWFLLAAAILFGLAIYALYRYRLAQVIKLERVRTRIATDLHDDLGASLSKIAILSEIVNHEVAGEAKNSRIEKSLTEIAGTSREMVDSMADIIWVINPDRDRLSDLIGRMRNLASEMTEFCEIESTIDSTGVETRDLNLSADLRREIYLIFKETLNNLIKHSGAERAEIKFLLNADDFVFTVKDDGCGFDANANRSVATRGGNGLTNMRKRAANLGGSYEIESTSGAGTIAVLRVPLKGKFSLANFLSK